MWLLFLADVAFAFAVLYIPGYLLFRVLKLARVDAAVFSPIVSALLLYLLAYGAASLGLALSWAQIVLPSFAIAGLARVLSMVWGQRKPSTSRRALCSGRTLIVGIVVACYVALYYFVVPLDGAASIAQENDNIYHLTTVRDFLKSGAYATQPFLTSYPCLWHTIVALVAGFGQTNVAVAVNAVNFLLVAIVFPSAMCLFLSVVLGKDHRSALFGSVLTSAFATFPWGFLLFGPLYPNLLGGVLLPIVAASFVLMLRSKMVSTLLPWLAVFCVGCVVLLRAHPNAVFSGIVLLAPYGAVRIYQIAHERFSVGWRLWLPPIAFSAFVVLVWGVLYVSPMFREVVTFEWAAYTSFSQAVSNVLQLGLTKASAPQWVLSALVLLGAVRCILRRDKCWLVVSYALMSLIYVACVSTDSVIQHVLAGFWYTDSFRVAALFPLAGVLLAALGLNALVRVLSNLVAGVAGESSSIRWMERCLSVLCCLVFLAANYWPNFDIPQNGNVVTGFGMVRSMLQGLNTLETDANALDSDELEFIGRVRERVGEERVFNYPYDGSAYAYALCDLNTVNRSWFYSGKSSDFGRQSESGTLAESIGSSGVQYVMLLDYDGMRDNGEGCYQSAGYDESVWSSFESITDSTPGFEVVLSEGDMRLYRIVG